jgi:acyl dehydratase
LGTIITHPGHFTVLVGEHLGHGRWVEVTEDLIDGFVAHSGGRSPATGARTVAGDAPFASAIAQGTLTLSIVIPLLDEIVVVENAMAVIHDGFDEVRFPAVVPVTSRVRLGATLGSVDAIAHGVRTTFDCVVEVDAGDRPAAVARVVRRYVF